MLCQSYTVSIYESSPPPLCVARSLAFKDMISHDEVLRVLFVEKICALSSLLLFFSKLNV